MTATRGLQVVQDCETADAYIVRISNLLALPTTRLYVDTSFLMWLAQVGPKARAQFFDWAAGLGDRIRIPHWAAHELNRHHTAGTLKTQVTRRAEKLTRATLAFEKEVRLLNDPSVGCVDEDDKFSTTVRDTAEQIRQITSLARSWDYHSAAAEVVSWVNDKTYASRAVYDRLPTLLATGNARYTQDVPPGFLDRRKRDTPKRGSNRFGDLLFWDDLLQDTSGGVAPAVVILTRDRKEDWYARTGEPEVSQSLKRLRPRWQPVPAPHPSLALEARLRSDIKTLALIDEVYLGAVLWGLDRTAYKRFATVAVDFARRGEQDIEQPSRPAADRALKRREDASISMTEAKDLFDAAFETPSQRVQEVLEGLTADIPAVDSFLADFDPESLAKFPTNELVTLGKRLHDDGQDPGPALQLLRDLMGHLDRMSADGAAAFYFGVTISAYFDGAAPRERPRSLVLDEIFVWQIDTAFKRVLVELGRRLRKVNSAVLYIPDGGARRPVLDVVHDATQQQLPVVLQQVYVDGKAVLRIGETRPNLQLRARLGGVSAAEVQGLVEAVCRHFGIDFERCVVKQSLKEERLVPETLGFMEFDRFSERPAQEPQRDAPETAEEEPGVLFDGDDADDDCDDDHDDEDQD